MSYTIVDILEGEACIEFIEIKTFRIILSIIKLWFNNKIGNINKKI
jgi:hypothetical protein